MEDKKMSRRGFVGSLGLAGAAAVVLPALADDQGPQGGRQRAEASEQVRTDRAEADGDKVPIPNHPNNGDEDRYSSKFASYSKCLKHDSIGEVDPAAYAALLNAIQRGSFEDFEDLFTNGHLGSTDPTTQRRLVNPISAYGYDMEGVDSHQFALPPSPKFASAEQAGEAVECYWMALLRDIDFSDYATNSLVEQACEDLSNISDFKGPKVNGTITPQTLFRDVFPGCTTGPYISQFLLQPTGFGAMSVDTRMSQVYPNADFMTTFQSWLDVQNGVNTPGTPTTGTKHYCSNGRDISHYVNVDALFEAYFVACLNLLSNGYLANTGNPYGQIFDGGAGRPRNLNVDPNGALAQVGFATFGGPMALTICSEPATRALKDEWYQKWLIHRKQRPEEFGGRVEVARLGRKSYPIHNDLLKSAGLAATISKNGTALLPMAYAEGSPNHPSYAEGHAVVSGAAITMLKWLFDDTQPIQNPVVPNPANGGQTLIPYVGPTLTVGGELNKLASNIPQARCIAGVHFRSDAYQGILLGEQAALSILRDTKKTFWEPFHGATFTTFDGTKVTV